MKITMYAAAEDPRGLHKDDYLDTFRTTFNEDLSVTDLQSVVSVGLTVHDPCGMPTA